MSNKSTTEKMVYDSAYAKTYHLVRDGKTLCGKSSNAMRRVAHGQFGDGFPPCLACLSVKEGKAI